MDNEYKRIATVILKVRGWDVDDLAQAVGVTRQAVYNWLNGKQPRIAERDKLRAMLIEWAEKYAAWFDLHGPGTPGQ